MIRPYCRVGAKSSPIAKMQATIEQNKYAVQIHNIKIVIEKLGNYYSSSSSVDPIALRGFK